MIDPEKFDLILKQLPKWDKQVAISKEGYTYQSIIPSHTLETLKNYLYDGVPMGHFLQACIANDLSQAFGRADAGNKAALSWIVALIYNAFPMAARDYKAWIAAHREKIERGSQD